MYNNLLLWMMLHIILRIFFRSSIFSSIFQHFMSGTFHSILAQFNSDFSTISFFSSGNTARCKDIKMDSGILRKTLPIENHDELLVFGYACKLFKDDEKAIFIDQGKHLIPWMGDEKLKVDRYDCRGAISDLSKYEASKEGYDATRWLGLSEKERQLEELCDNERYYSLKMNEEEEEMYKEEDLKRKKTNAIQYSYDVPQNPELKNDGIPTVPEADEIDEEYTPPPILDVPVDIEMPATVKENARIEKTALFVCRQGLQMEILIKAKQADNPQFSFLNQGDPLYKFYRHVLAAFKNGRYQGYVANTNKKGEEMNNSADQDTSGHYLHPSLSSNPESEPPTSVTVPQIQYKPSINCSYSQLVNRIQGSQNDGGEVQKTANPDFSQMTYEQQQQYYHYYYAQQYYEYYKQMAVYQQGQGGNPGQFVPPPDIPNLDPNMQAYIQQIAYQQYLQHQSNSSSSYAQIISNISKDGTAYTPQLAQTTQLSQTTQLAQTPQPEKALVVYGPEARPPEDERKVTIVKDKPEVVVNKPLLSLADYSSASDSESEDDLDEEKPPVQDEKEVYKVPTGEMLAVIDKMAVYVSKNGEQFEEIVRAKKDPRFEFLNGDNEFNRYYREKMKELKGEISAEEKGDKKKEDGKAINEVERDEKKVDEEHVEEVKVVKKERKVIAPVSFSIKKAKEDHPKELKSALPVEESDDEEETEVKPTTSAALPITETSSATTDNTSKLPLTSVLMKFSENQKKIEQEKPVNRETPEKDESSTVTTAEIEVSENNEDAKTNKQKQEKKVEKKILIDDDPIFELIELTDDIDDDRKDNHADDKIKVKSSDNAKEKITSAARERALQLERKRKAAAFLKLKTAGSNTEKSELPSSAPEKDTHSRRVSIEIIEIDDESPPKQDLLRDRSKSIERSYSIDRDRSDSRERSRDGKRKKTKKKEKKHKSREKRRRSDSVEDEEEENSRRKDEERRERKKKSHKRKHSKTKKKSKKRHKHSDSDDSNDNSSS